MPKTVRRKSKKSFTLSRSSVSFLERLRKERKASSTSLILDERILELEAQHRQNATGRAIAAYYSNLSEEELREEQAWGEFAFEQLSEDANR